MNAIAIRASIHEIEHHRNQALDLYGQAFDLVAEAMRAAATASPSGHFQLPALLVSGRHFPERDRDTFLEGVRREVDKGVWQHLLRATNLDKLMDKTAREDFRAQLDKDPPPATADNCRATLEQLLGDADMIFKRGIATAFSRLDRRFRSHDGFKIGARIVLSYFADQHGYISRGGRDETLLDVERTFYVLDGKPQPDRAGGIMGAVELARSEARTGFMEGAAYSAEAEYFRVRVFKNGNAHVWFKRDDLVEKVNLLLADYYGASIGAAPDVADRHHAPATTPAKNFGFFESPPPVVDRLLEEAGIWSGRGGGLRILEPNAGKGAIARRLCEAGAEVVCVEVQSQHIPDLQQLGAAEVLCADFLSETAARLGLFDVVVMNPPFDGGRDIDHVTHALRFLKPGGRLVAVMSAGVEFREDRKTADFRALVERFGGRFRDLPPGSFAASGTNVNTVVLRLEIQR